MILNEWEDNKVFEEVFESENEWEDESEVPEDTRPAWAKRIQGWHHNWAQIDLIKGVVGDIKDDANVDIRTRPVRIGDRSYVVDVFLDGVQVGTYSY